ncbi:PREDICTED: melanoma antigen preferentially expressed in tumors [Condylura cristata]|uniref:melanoma antigen preferentially expressed in tumors n=1 Tax=Condylura cristata TaxID=143302 RepID=UPI000642D5CD|nr:PREDICTED: melanoma antigen preferentially expressed in tumors [Condylura cristata]
MWPKLPQVYFQDSFRSRFIRLSMMAPPRLLELACQSLLRDETLAIAALELLPMELFPPLFTAAFAGRHNEILKVMVQAWPFACLPLGALMKDQQLHRETLQAVLDGLDVLLGQEVRPRRWRLQVLDLRKNAHQDFWTVWSGIKPFLEPELAQPTRKRRKVEGSRTEPKQPLAPLEVLIDVCLKDGTPNESLVSLLKKVKQKKGLLHLCCKKLKIFVMPMQNIRKILKLVQLESIQDLEVNCTWKLPTLSKFAPHVGQMGNLRRLLLSHIHMAPLASLAKEERCISQFTSQFLKLNHLQELYLDSISFLKGRLDQMLRCLKTPLETLSITNCLLLESDLVHLSQGLNVSQLKDLGLSGVNLTTVSPEPLQVLIERASATLQDLDLDECGIMDMQFTSILPALGRCSQLTTFSFCGNPISMAVLEDLLRHTIGLSKLSHVLYPAPLESYEDVRGTLHLGRLAYLHAKLKQMLHEAGRPGVVWFSANPCPHCGERTFYDPDPILCPCYMPA